MKGFVNGISTNNVKPRSAIERVLKNVEKITESGCWIFMGAVNEAGYGIVGLGGRGSPNDRAHRITYRHFVGETPDGMVVCHHCDVRPCCNPEHLFLGTHKDNNADMRRKNRHSNPPRNPHDRGERRHNAKLTNDKVRWLRIQHSLGVTIYALAKNIGISWNTVADAVRGESWSHVR